MTNPTGSQSELETVRRALAADYEVIRELGRGGMAIVYQARETALDREVAIKVLPFAVAFDEGVVERFQREAKTAAQLEHPHIVPIYRVGRSGDVIYFVMKYLRGQSLGDRLLEHGPLPVRDIRRILSDAGSALGYAARRGVVHRDIKPDNIMLDEDGRATVTDFGIARSAADSRLTATGMSLGTPRYMSPEQARAKPLDVRSDLYSLGAVAYECLTGSVPFDGEDAVAILMDHVNKPLPRPALASDEERALFPVIERMLAKKPEDRFQSAEEMLAALEGGPTLVVPSAGDATAAGAARTSRKSRGAALAPTAPARSVSGTDEGARPPLSATASEMGSRLRAHAGRAAAIAGAWSAAAASRAREGARWAVARGTRFWIGVAGAVALVIAGYWGIHFATMHRSRCSPTAERADSAGADGSKGGSPARSLVLLVDAPPPQDAGEELDLYYDVCGLEKGAAYSTRVDISRNQSGLRRIFGGGVQPVSLSFDERAGSPATRRHRDVDLGTLPEGAYTLKVTVTDDRGRRRERSHPLQIRP